jgi:glutathione reductase (NADPH)
VPKKLFVLGSHVHQEIEGAAGFGWTIPQATFDWPTLIANKDKEIARLEAAYTTNVEKSGAEMVKSRAVFEDPHTLRLADGRKVTAKYALIATVGRPNHGTEIPGIEHVISSDEAFHLKAIAEGRGAAGRRLYRAGIRLHLRRLWQRRHAGLSRRKYPARFR